MEQLLVQASRQRLRFGNGNLTVEDLWGLDLTNARNPKAITLDSLAIEVHLALQQTAQISFVTEKTNKNKADELRLAILKAIIETKQSEKADANKQEAARSELNKLLEIKAQRADQALISASDEDIEKRIEAAKAQLS
jgi:hypothetical protein